jgi:hypothetical protein
MSRAPERIVDGRREYLSRSINQWVPVAGEKVQSAPTKKERRRASNPRVMLRLVTLARAAKATRSPRLFVWAWLQYEAWWNKSMTVNVANGELEHYGINRERKLRALLDLEAAGLIRVERSGRDAVTIILIDPETTSPYRGRLL